MAKVLGVELEELGPMSFQSESPIGITKTCSVLAQFDVMCMLNDGKDVADIAAGVNRAMAERISKITKKVGIREVVAMTGGVAKNSAVVKSLKEFWRSRCSSKTALIRRLWGPSEQPFLPGKEQSVIESDNHGWMLGREAMQYSPSSRHRKSRWIERNDFIHRTAGRSNICNRRSEGEFCKSGLVP